MMSQLSEQLLEDSEDRREYVNCVDWLNDGKEFVLIKRTIAKKNLPDAERNSYIEAAEEAVQSLIIKKYKDVKACVIPQVDNFRSPCTKGGITVPQQRKILRKQARLYFKLSHKGQNLAEEEAEEREDFESEAEKIKEQNVVVNNNKVVVNTNKDDQVVVIDDEEDDDDDDEGDDEEEEVGD